MRDGVLPADPEKVLDVGQGRSPSSPSGGYHLVADLWRAAAWKKSGLFHAQEPSVGDEQLEELVLLRALDAEAAQRFLRTWGRGPGAAEVCFHPSTMRCCSGVGGSCAR